MIKERFGNELGMIGDYTGKYNISIPQSVTYLKLWRRVMAMLDKPPRYRSFLFTFWEERSQNPDASVVWRFSLTDSRTGQRYGFASLEEMIAFLKKELVSKEDKLSNWYLMFWWIYPAIGITITHRVGTHFAYFALKKAIICHKFVIQSFLEWGILKQLN